MSWVHLIAPLWVLTAAQERPAYRVVVEAVHVDVLATHDGAPLSGLTRDDFELLDDGVPQEIDFVSVHREPMSVALILDVSDSVAGATLTRLKTAARTFLRGLDAADRVTLVTFSHYLHQRSPMTHDFAAVRDVIDRVQPGGGTAWHDALFVGLELLEGSSRRPFLLLFTDGEDTYSWLDGDVLPPRVKESSAVVYAISNETTVHEGRGRRVTRKQLLEEVTRAGGGRLIETETSELETGFAEVLSEMRNRYLLSYRPRGVPREGWHTIEVKLRRRNGEVRARRGYLYRSNNTKTDAPVR